MMIIDYCIMALASLTLLLAVQRVVPISHGQFFVNLLSAEIVMESVQGESLSGKPGNVREFDS